MPYIYCPYCDKKIFIRTDRYIEHGKPKSFTDSVNTHVPNQYNLNKNKLKEGDRYGKG